MHAFSWATNYKVILQFRYATVFLLFRSTTGFFDMLISNLTCFFIWGVSTFYQMLSTFYQDYFFVFLVTLLF